MKEQLIRELVKTGKDAETLNKQYAEKIKHLERVGVPNIIVRSIDACKMCPPRVFGIDMLCLCVL